MRLPQNWHAPRAVRRALTEATAQNAGKMLSLNLTGQLRWPLPPVRRAHLHDSGPNMHLGGAGRGKREWAASAVRTKADQSFRCRGNLSALGGTRGNVSRLRLCSRSPVPRCAGEPSLRNP